jgi:hypothetical protein
MSLLLLSLFPLAAGFGFLYWADQLDVEHDILKLFFQLLFLPLTFLSINFAVIYARLVWAADAELVSLLGISVTILGWIMFIIGAYLVYILFMRVKDVVLRKKQEKMEEKYG